jgi:ferric-dicitrate binding protein FerR (iron transport regulator)
MNEHKHDIDENLLLKFLLGQTSEGENSSITDWLDQDPAHRYILEKLESLWLETGKLVPAPVAVDIEMAWLKITDRIDFGATDQQAGMETPTPDDVGPSGTALNMGPDVALQRDKSQSGSDYDAREGLGKGIGRRITGDVMRQDEQGEPAGEGKQPRQDAEILKAAPEKVMGTQLRIYAFRIAATLLILAGIYVVIFLLTRPAGEVMIAAVNGNITDTIPDGTIITLHQGSTLAYSHDFNENERRIRLSGEAFFEVTRDAAKPFVVEAGGADVKVLGTSFLVSVESDGEEERGGENGEGRKGQLTIDNGQLTMENGKLKIENEAGLPAFSTVTNFTSPVTRHASPVTPLASRLPATSWLETTVRVEHGRVMLFRVDERTGDTMSLFLEAGMRGRLARGMKAPVLSGAARPDEMFWKDRSLDFRQTPLREVIALLGKHYGITVAVSQPRALGCLLTASFRGESPEQIVSVIAASFNLVVKSTPSGYLLEGAGCLEEKE